MVWTSRPGWEATNKAVPQSVGNTGSVGSGEVDSLPLGTRKKLFKFLSAKLVSNIPTNLCHLNLNSISPLRRHLSIKNESDPMPLWANPGPYFYRNLSTARRFIIPVFRVGLLRGARFAPVWLRQTKPSISLSHRRREILLKTKAIGIIVSYQTLISSILH
ncbi:hypothetical protein CH361_07560 [Leptospira brenneri]|nr:hypothetical protein CH361_07560 [Leptospira brenneri]